MIIVKTLVAVAGVAFVCLFIAAHIWALRTRRKGLQRLLEEYSQLYMITVMVVAAWEYRAEIARLTFSDIIPFLSVVTAVVVFSELVGFLLVRRAARRG